jgi:hypothetical protein
LPRSRRCGAARSRAPCRAQTGAVRRSRSCLTYYRHSAYCVEHAQVTRLHSMRGACAPKMARHVRRASVAVMFATRRSGMAWRQRQGVTTSACDTK